MKAENNNRSCKGVRDRLYAAVRKHVGIEPEWVRNHVAHCPRCRRRLAAAAKVNLALSLIKSQPHSLELLQHANAGAVGVLKHSLRNCAKAQKLKTVLPEPHLPEKCRPYKNPALNAAACIALLFLTKTTIFSSMLNFQSDGQQLLKQYYTNQIGEDLADEIFYSQPALFRLDAGGEA